MPVSREMAIARLREASAECSRIAEELENFRNITGNRGGWDAQRFKSYIRSVIWSD